MRHYPRNSPQAAARIVALAMLADGRMTKAELNALARADAVVQLGLQPAQWKAIVYGLCEDLLSAADRTGGAMCRIDPYTLAMLMKEVDEPGLRAKVLNLCVAVIEADEHIADSESVVLTTAVECWGMFCDLRAVKRTGAAPSHA